MSSMQSLQGAHGTPLAGNGIVIDCSTRELYYGTFKAVRDTQIPVHKNEITAFIGPSGCGKSTVLRCLNRMNDLVRGFRFEGQVCFRGRDIYAPAVDPVAVRRHIGMVFQQPTPFATSAYNNVAFGLRLNNFKGDRATTCSRRPVWGIERASSTWIPHRAGARATSWNSVISGRYFRTPKKSIRRPTSAGPSAD